MEPGQESWMTRCTGHDSIVSLSACRAVRAREATIAEDVVMLEQTTVTTEVPKVENIVTSQMSGTAHVSTPC